MTTTGPRKEKKTTHATRYLTILIIAALVMPLIPVAKQDMPGVSSEPSDEGSSGVYEPPSTTADAYGTGNDSLISNVLENGDMESWESVDEPSSWSTWGTGFSSVNSSYSDDYYSGSYSCQLAGQYAHQFWGGASIEQQYDVEPVPYLSQNIEMSNRWNALEAPDPLPSLAFYLSITIYTDTGTYDIVYCLLFNTGAGYENGTTRAYFMLNGSMNVWSLLNRNVSADFESVFRPVQSNDYVLRMSWLVESFPGAESPTEVLLDSCSLANGTGYEYMVNGGFESGSTGWSHSSSRSPSYVTTSTDRHAGSYSANMTTSAGQNSVSSATLSRGVPWPNGYLLQAPGIGGFEFWYNYDDVWNGGSLQQAFVSCYFHNHTHDYYVHIWLGQYQNAAVSGNSSQETYIRAPGYGDRGTWHHVYVDLGAVLAGMGATGGAIGSFAFYCYAGYGAGSKTALLVDDIRYHDYPTGDPGFEQDWTDYNSHPDCPLPAYDTSYYPVVNRSDDAFEGQYAAKITVSSGNENGFMRRFPYVPYSQDLFFSLQWKLDSVGSYPTPYYSQVLLRFDESRDIMYEFTYGNLVLTNTSSVVRYLVRNFNQTGSWYHLLRNVTEDYFDAFGDANWKLTQIYFDSWCESSEPLVILYDNVDFVDGTPPEVDSTQRVTTMPVYYEPVIVQTHAVDALPGVKQVLVYYSAGGAPVSLVTTHVGGGVYQASIPAQPWNTTVEWYVYAEDACGTWRIDDNNGAMYQYTVGDDIEPNVDVSAPTPDSTVSGDVDVSLTASDTGSGIERVELSVDSVVMIVDYTPPYALVWNSRAVGNGSQTLVCTAFDNAGNSHSDSVIVDVQNDVAGPVLSSIQLNPDPPQYGEQVVVMVAVTDATAVENVTLSCRFGGAPWQRGLMTRSASLYTGTILANNWNTQVWYYVEAFDVFGQVTAVGSESEPLVYVVGDSVAPILAVTGPPPTDNLSGVVDFSITAFDAGSGIASVTMYVDGVLDDTPQEGPSVAHWDTTKVADGEHVVLFVAEDYAGNTASISFTYRVRNPVGFEAISNAFSQIMSSYGFFIGIGVMALVIGVGKVLMSRRAAGTAASAPKEKKK